MQIGSDMPRRIFILIFILLYGFGHCDARIFRNISLSDGLSDLLVNTIYKDSEGRIWLGMGNALDCFDGVHVKQYPVIGINEVQKRVNAIVELPGKGILMGNGAGLWHIDKVTEKLERTGQETINCGVQCFLLHNDTLYIGTENGLYIRHGSTTEHILLHSSEFDPANFITGLYLKEGDLWLSSWRGLHVMTLQSRKIKSYDYNTGFSSIAGIGNTIYLGTSTMGLVEFEPATGQFRRSVNVGCNIVSALSSDGEGLLYVGTDGNGVHVVSADEKRVVRSFRHSSESDSELTSNAVYALLVDRDNLLWIGFYQEGFDYSLYQNDIFTTHQATTGMKVRAIAIHGAEKLIGTREGLLFTNDSTGYIQFFDRKSLNSQMVFSILYHEGEYYIGTYGGGMYTFDNRKMELRPFLPEAEELAKGQIFCICPDAAGSLWIGSNTGLYRYRDKKLTVYTSANSQLPQGNVYEIFFDSKGKGWICTETGVCIWDSTARRIRNDIFPENFLHKEKIRSVYEDSGHQLYFIPDRGGIYVSDLSMHNFRHYLPPNSPLVDKDGQCIIEDEQNRLWIATNNGLYCFDRSGACTPYDFTDGIPSPTFTLCKPVKDEEGCIWFGNTKGLLRLDPRHSDKPAGSYPVSITDIRIDGKSIGLPLSAGEGEKIVLKKRPGSLTFCIADLRYTAPEVSTFMVKLEGRGSSEWETVTGKSDITYYSPSWGVQKFIVKRPNEDFSQAAVSVYIPLPGNSKLMIILFIIFISALIIIYITAKKIGIRIRRGKIVIENRAFLAPADKKYKDTSLDDVEKERLLATLESVMKTQKPYIRADLKLADLAVATGISSQTLSYLFSQHLNSSYYDYINKFRIMEFKRLVHTGEFARYTLTALAERCGFNSRASFFRYFKKETGLTPNEYISQKRSSDNAGKSLKK